MRNVILLCLAVLVGNSYAQTPLTNGEVYDYEVGDVIQSKFEDHTFGGTLNYTKYINRTVLSRTDINEDSVRYQVREETVILENCVGCQPTNYTNNIVTEAYGNLTNFVSHEGIPTTPPYECYHLGVTDSLDYCGRRTIRYYGIEFDSTYINCSDPFDHPYTYIEGIGMFEGIYGSFTGAYTRTELIAYTKNGVTCGNMLPVGTQNKTTALDLSVFPNPITNQLNIAENAEVETYKIFDLNGACVQMGTISGKNIDVSALPKGNFIGVFYAPNGEFVRQKLTKL